MYEATIALLALVAAVMPYAGLVFLGLPGGKRRWKNAVIFWIAGVVSVLLGYAVVQAHPLVREWAHRCEWAAGAVIVLSVLISARRIHAMALFSDSGWTGRQFRKVISYLVRYYGKAPMKLEIHVGDQGFTKVWYGEKAVLIVQGALEGPSGELLKPEAQADLLYDIMSDHGYPYPSEKLAATLSGLTLTCADRRVQTVGVVPKEI